MTDTTSVRPRVGTRLPTRTFVISRADLMRYCGATADFTAIHWNERVARAVGLPDVIAHGTLTVSRALHVVTDWLGDPGALVEYEVERFARPLAVPDDDTGATLQVDGEVTEVGDGRAVLRLTIGSGGQTVVSGLRVVVRLPS
ncbi:MaoC/PaaZ C-terminal domain-containing protein [Kitasatospora sp. NPDC001309]|uniref:MaoC/PaaZ C-terminal domain-containing protein n=1 Tax=Kitasatospora sp. NPDC001309 TaxID=3364013 RepID=UPI0036BFFD9A